KPLLIELDEVRALMGGAAAPAPTPAPAPVVAAAPAPVAPVAPAPVVAAAPEPVAVASAAEPPEEAKASISRAESQLRWARSNMDSRRYDEVERNVQQALDLV